MFTSILTNFSSLLNYSFFELHHTNMSSQSPATQVKNPSQNTDKILLTLLFPMNFKWLSCNIVCRRGTKSHLKSQFPPEMTLLKSQQNFQTHLKSNFLLLPFPIYTSKSFQDDWSQVKNRQNFIDRHLLIPIN